MPMRVWPKLLNMYMKWSKPKNKEYIHCIRIINSTDRQNVYIGPLPILVKIVLWETIH